MPSIIPFGISGIESKSKATSRTYRMDWENGRICSDKIDGEEALQQAIKKALLTPRFKCLAYDNDYGSEIASEILMRNDIDEDDVETMLPDLIREALIGDDRIIDITDIEITAFEGDALSVSFHVESVFGGFDEEVEISV